MEKTKCHGKYHYYPRFCVFLMLTQSEEYSPGQYTISKHMGQLIGTRQQGQCEAIPWLMREKKNGSHD
jgi:hypothetical protein